MTSNREEENKVLGFRARRGPRSWRDEEQHVLGFPASWFDSVNVDALAWLVHPIQEYRRWARRRHEDPHVPGEDER